MCSKSRFKYKILKYKKEIKNHIFSNSEVTFFNLFPFFFTFHHSVLYLYTEGKGNPHLSITMRVVEQGKINQF